MEMSINPPMNDMYISRDISVKSVRSSDGYTWLGFGCHTQTTCQV